MCYSSESWTSNNIRTIEPEVVDSIYANSTSAMSSYYVNPYEISEQLQQTNQEVSNNISEVVEGALAISTSSSYGLTVDEENDFDVLRPSDIMCLDQPISDGINIKREETETHWNNDISQQTSPISANLTNVSSPSCYYSNFEQSRFFYTTQPLSIDHTHFNSNINSGENIV
ncbi:hypothetical protein CHUAL_011689 [Chamberlinius hualienensis]